MSNTGRICAAMVGLFLALASARACYGETENGSVTVPPAHVNDVFDVANEEYKNGNYADAIKLYEGLLAGTEHETEDIYYNLGNAHFRLQEYGKAIASYRRALQRNPRDADIRANLRYVRSQTKDKIDRPKGTEILQEIFFFHYDFNQAESEFIFFVAYVLTAGVASAYLFFRYRVLKWLSVCGLAFAMAFGGSTLAHAYRDVNPNGAVIVVDEATVRTGPGSNYMVSYYLHDGTELEVRKQVDGWYQIELPDERRGWVQADQTGII